MGCLTLKKNACYRRSTEHAVKRPFKEIDPRILTAS
jgi:hypothetical protein